MSSKPIVKEYPQPNPAISTGSTSRFDQVMNGIITPGIVTPNFPDGEWDNTIKDGKIAFLPNGKTSKGRDIAPYIPSEDIKEIVRLAQILQRPVLIKGEPGSGKTQLSKAVAYEWYGDNYKQHFFEWTIKSTSKAVDGLYSFDHIARLRDAQLAQTDEKLRNRDNKAYRKFGPMAMAFLTSTADAPSILLIDEIDKADIDFPNDLLLELDERRFRIPDSETGELIEANYPPLIFITSNDEREMPEAFLRRCLFLYIEFPKDGQLRKIIEAHLPELMKSQQELVSTIVKEKKDVANKDFIDLAIAQFRVLKKEREDDPADNKRISTSELLDWLKAFSYDWENQVGMFDEAKAYLEKYLSGQIDGKDKLKEDFESRSIANYSFYSQTVLKSFAAVNKRESSVNNISNKPLKEKNEPAG